DRGDRASVAGLVDGTYRVEERAAGRREGTRLRRDRRGRRGDTDVRGASEARARDRRRRRADVVARGGVAAAVVADGRPAERHRADAARRAEVGDASRPTRVLAVRPAVPLVVAELPPLVGLARAAGRLPDEERAKARRLHHLDRAVAVEVADGRRRRLPLAGELRPAGRLDAGGV